MWGELKKELDDASQAAARPDTDVRQLLAAAQLRLQAKLDARNRIADARGISTSHDPC